MVASKLASLKKNSGLDGWHNFIRITAMQLVFVMVGPAFGYTPDLDKNTTESSLASEHASISVTNVPW